MNRFTATIAINKSNRLMGVTAGQCGCEITLVGYRGEELPDWLTLSLDPPGYEKRVEQLEAEGLTRSDAQGVADMEYRTKELCHNEN